jgi:hypothetical protein
MGLGSLSNQRDSLSPRPATLTGRAVSGSSNQGRPSSEFLPTGAAREQARTPEAEQIDQWFKHLASWEATLVGCARKHVTDRCRRRWPRRARTRTSPRS